MNEGGSPPKDNPPLAEEVSTIRHYQRVLSDAKKNNQNVLVEFYTSGCCYYNGEVGTVNELIKIYGASLVVIEVDSSTEAGQEYAYFERNRYGQLEAPSPQFRLMIPGNTRTQIGAISGNQLERWINDWTNLNGSTNLVNVNVSDSNGCPNN